MRGVFKRMIVTFAAGAALGLVFARHTSAQNTFDNTPEPGSSADRYGNLSDLGGNPFDNPDDTVGMQADSSGRRPRHRKPLESYFFDDSTRLEHNFMWHVDMLRNRVEKQAIDTALSNFQLDYPFQRRGVGDAYQGNLGGASVPYSFFDRPQNNDFAFNKGYYSYYVTPETANFYNVKAPFTQFAYLTAGQKSRAEENFGITHAQNISPSTGFNVDYKSRGTRGQYANQRGRDKNLSIALSHTGKKYTVHAGYIYNAVLNHENGGITDDRFVTDTVIDLSQAISVRMSDAKNTIKNNTYYVVQSYGIPLRRLSDEDFSISDRSSLFIGLSTEYQRWWKKYSDTRNGTTYYPGFPTPDDQAVNYYENWYISPTATNDSIFESRFSNRAFVQIQPWDRDGVIGTIDAGAGIDLHHFYQFGQDQLLSGDRKGVNETSYYVYGSVDGKISRYFDWGGDVTLHPAGYKSGDLQVGAYASLSAFIKGKPITLSGKFTLDNRSPDYWSQHLYSNHYKWDNSFGKENETRIEVDLDIPAIGLEAAAMQSVLTDKVYYNAASLPSQHDGNVSVTGVYASKGFRIGVGRHSEFHFNHRVLLQWSTLQEVVPVPLAAAFVSYYFEFNVVKDVLRCQFGVDGRYNTSYYAQAWNPATAQFYNQREREIGNYFKADVFLNAKWKRMRIFLKMEHANEDLIGPRRYFTVPNYPLNRRVFKYGISWSFYN